MPDIEQTPEQIIRNYHAARRAFMERLSEELEKLGDVAAQDVRRAKAELAVPRELADALQEATVAVELLNLDREERLVAAYEGMGIQRRASVVN